MGFYEGIFTQKHTHILYYILCILLYNVANGRKRLRNTPRILL